MCATHFGFIIGFLSLETKTLLLNKKWKRTSSIQSEYKLGVNEQVTLYKQKICSFLLWKTNLTASHSLHWKPQLNNSNYHKCKVLYSSSIISGALWCPVSVHQGKMSGRDLMRVLTLESGILTSSSISMISHWKQILAIQFTCLCGSGTLHQSSAQIQVSHQQFLPINMFGSCL